MKLFKAPIALLFALFLIVGCALVMSTASAASLDDLDDAIKDASDNVIKQKNIVSKDNTKVNKAKSNLATQKKELTASNKKLKAYKEKKSYYLKKTNAYAKKVKKYAKKRYSYNYIYNKIRYNDNKKKYTNYKKLVTKWTKIVKQDKADVKTATNTYNKATSTHKADVTKYNKIVRINQTFASYATVEADIERYTTAVNDFYNSAINTRAEIDNVGLYEKVVDLKAAFDDIKDDQSDDMTNRLAAFVGSDICQQAITYYDDVASAYDEGIEGRTALNNSVYGSNFFDGTTDAQTLVERVISYANDAFTPAESMVDLSMEQYDRFATVINNPSPENIMADPTIVGMYGALLTLGSATNYPSYPALASAINAFGTMESLFAAFNGFDTVDIREQYDVLATLFA
ncbi:MAG: hypothetical protein LBM96_12645 [Methanobrevibacter sp.]|nr:hypothetical protein [Candidatus Methanoflexus mossambicus]